MKRFAAAFRSLTVVGTLLLLSGCNNFYSFTTDVEVYWSIDGSDAAQLCNFYDIGSWEVSIDGPEFRSFAIDCTDLWDSADDFYNLDEGTYSVQVTAVDPFGVPIVTGEVVDTFFEGRIEVVDIDFTDADFF